MDRLIDPEYVEAENERVLAMVTAMYVKSLYPDLTIEEVFEKLQDVEFIKEVIRGIIEEKPVEKTPGGYVLVKRFCHSCDKVTKWSVGPDGKHWENHICTKCNQMQRFKTS